MRKRKLSINAKLFIAEILILIAVAAFLLGGYMIVEAG